GPSRGSKAGSLRGPRRGRQRGGTRAGTAGTGATGRGVAALRDTGRRDRLGGVRIDRPASRPAGNALRATGLLILLAAGGRTEAAAASPGAGTVGVFTSSQVWDFDDGGTLKRLKLPPRALFTIGAAGLHEIAGAADATGAFDAEVAPDGGLVACGGTCGGTYCVRVADLEG